MIENRGPQFVQFIKGCKYLLLFSSSNSLAHASHIPRSGGTNAAPSLSTDSFIKNLSNAFLFISICFISIESIEAFAGELSLISFSISFFVKLASR